MLRHFSRRARRPPSTRPSRIGIVMTMKASVPAGASAVNRTSVTSPHAVSNPSPIRSPPCPSSPGTVPRSPPSGVAATRLRMLAVEPSGGSPPSRQRGGLTTRLGEVAPASGSGAMAAVSPYFARSSSTSPNSRARRARLDAHRGEPGRDAVGAAVALDAVPEPPVDLRGAVGARQRTVAASDAAPRVDAHQPGGLLLVRMAPVGHTCTQTGRAQWLHATETK